LGLPTTMNLALLEEAPAGLPEPTPVFFGGSTSPPGHPLPVLVATDRLSQRAAALGAAPAVVDTSGLVGGAAGGGAGKEWKIELLRPATVVALQAAGELELLLGPLRRRRDLSLHVLPVAPEVRRRSPEARAARRRQRYRVYFAAARPLAVALRGLPVYG